MAVEAQVPSKSKEQTKSVQSPMKITPPTKADLAKLALDPLWTAQVNEHLITEVCENVYGSESKVKCKCAHKTLNDGCYGNSAPTNDPTCKYLCHDLSELREDIISSHKRYYSNNTTIEERIEIDIALTSRFCRSFVPSIAQVNYWTYVAPTGEVTFSLCSEGLCTLLGGKKRAVTLKEAEAEMEDQGVVFFQNGKNKVIAFRTDISEEFKKKFVPKKPRKGSKKKKEADNTGPGKCEIYTAVGCIFTRLLNKNTNTDSQMVLSVPRGNNGQAVPGTVDMVGTYLAAARKVYINHKAVEALWRGKILPLKQFQWEYKSKNKKQKNKIMVANRQTPQKRSFPEIEAADEGDSDAIDKLLEEETFNGLYYNSQTFGADGTVDNNVALFKRNLGGKKANGRVLKRVLFMDPAAIYPVLDYEKKHKLNTFWSVDAKEDKDANIIGTKLGCRVEMKARVPWVHRTLVSYVKVELTEEDAQRETEYKNKLGAGDTQTADKEKQGDGTTDDDEEDDEDDDEEDDGDDEEDAREEIDPVFGRKTTVYHSGEICLSEIDTAGILEPLRLKALQAAGPDFNNSYLGNGGAKKGGFKRMSIKMENAEQFDYFFEYRMVEPLREDHQAAEPTVMNSTLIDLAKAMGIKTKKDTGDIAALEKLIEDLVIFASTGTELRLKKAPPGRGARVGTGEVPVEDAEDAAPGNDDPLAEVVLKFKNDLTGKNKEGKKIEVYRDDVAVVVQHSRLCGARDYRMSDEMVVQLPGLPIEEGDLVKLGEEKTEVYEVLVPLDRTGLLVLMTPFRGGIRVVEDQPYTPQGEDNDYKILLFVRYGSAIILPATAHYTAFHRTSMTGGLHIKSLVTVSRKKFGGNHKEVKPQLPTPPLGNVAVGYKGPVGIKIPGNGKDNIAGGFHGNLKYDAYGAMNGQFGLHLSDVEMLKLFSTFCLPAQFNNRLAGANNGGGGGGGGDNNDDNDGGGKKGGDNNEGGNADGQGTAGGAAAAAN